MDRLILTHCLRWRGDMMVETTLIIGGTRSGKSHFAEKIVSESGKKCVYIATAEIRDEEMRQRVALHQSRRDVNWQTLEAPLDLVATLKQTATQNTILLVDCLTLWLSNIMLANQDIDAASRALCTLVADPPCDMVLVTNEVGSGIVPDNALARRFRDVAGLLNQHVAARVNNVYLVVAGLPLRLKG